MVKRRDFLKNIGIVGIAVPMTGLINERQLLPDKSTDNRLISVKVKGVVKDKSGPLKGIAVSDGFMVTVTDKLGKYQLLADPEAEFVYISVPSGFEIPNHNGIAGFYQHISHDKPIIQADFSLEKLAVEDEKHVFIIWADPQIQTAEHAAEVSNVSIPDLKETIASYPKGTPIHGIGCGDLVWDHVNLFEEYKKQVALSGLPFFQLIGNHDLDLDARADEGSAKSFRKEFGPSYFSFNRGKIHYVCMDNVFYLGTGRRFIGYITETQLHWLEQDLALIIPGNTVVLSLHIPANNGHARRYKLKEDDFTAVLSNREQLYKILAPHNVHIMSGHTHFIEHLQHENFHEHVNGAVCGAWWTGPICWDGTPKGYAVYEVNGNELNWYYKAVGKGRDHQLRLYPAGSSTVHPDNFIANVWNWDSSWKVEWLEDGVIKGDMQQYTGLDPLAVQLFQGEQKPAGQTWIEPYITDHLFTAKASASATKIEVLATDRFGKIYRETLH